MVNLKIKFYKATWIMLILFVILAGLDFYSTARTGSFARYLETNYIYVLTRSWLLLIFLNILALYILMKSFDTHRVYVRYMVCACFVTLCIVRFIVILNNFEVGEAIDNKQITLEQVKQVSDLEKINSYTETSVLLLIFPITVSMLTYWLFGLDNRMVLKNG